MQFKAGSIVKVRIGEETIWTRITAKLDFGYRATLANQPVTFAGDMNDPVEFTEAAIVDIFPGTPPLTLVK